MTRPRLLLADDVGLGKTAEAGLVITELMARRRATRILIVTPAGPLLAQWKEEIGLSFSSEPLPHLVPHGTTDLDTGQEACNKPKPPLRLSDLFRGLKLSPQ